MFILFLNIVYAIFSVLAGIFFFLAPGRREIQEMTIDNVDFGTLRDGTYVGEYNGLKHHFRDTRVEVTISAGEISEIKILRGAAVPPCGQNITDLFDRVIKSRSLHEDAVGGATLIGKAHLKALENALRQAQAK